MICLSESNLSDPDFTQARAVKKSVTHQARDVERAFSQCCLVRLNNYWSTANDMSCLTASKLLFGSRHHAGKSSSKKTSNVTTCSRCWTWVQSMLFRRFQTWRFHLAYDVTFLCWSEWLLVILIRLTSFLFFEKWTFTESRTSQFPSA
jgi:hypothetical protein